MIDSTPIDRLTTTLEKLKEALKIDLPSSVNAPPVCPEFLEYLSCEIEGLIGENKSDGLDAFVTGANESNWQDIQKKALEETSG